MRLTDQANCKKQIVAPWDQLRSNFEPQGRCCVSSSRDPGRIVVHRRGGQGQDGVINALDKCELHHIVTRPPRRRSISTGHLSKQYAACAAIPTRSMLTDATATITPTDRIRHQPVICGSHHKLAADIHGYEQDAPAPATMQMRWNQ